MVYLRIGKSQHTKPLTGHESITPTVILHAIRLKMAAAVYFDDQLRRRTVKICDIGAKGLLTTEVVRVSAQIHIPQLPFLGRKIGTKFSGAGNQFCRLHNRPPPPLRGTSPLKGEAGYAYTDKVRNLAPPLGDAVSESD